MLKEINKKRLTGTILAGILTIAGVTTAFAANQPDGRQQPFNHGQPGRISFSQMSTQYKSALDSLVAAGTITQEQEDAIVNTMPGQNGKGRSEGQGQRMNPMSSLVEEGTITQAQADAIQEAMKGTRDSLKKSE